MESDDEYLKHLTHLERRTVEDFVERFITTRRQAPTEVFDQTPETLETMRRKALRLVLANLPSYVQEYKRQARDADDPQMPDHTDTRRR